MDIGTILVFLWIALVILYVGFKPRIEGILFRKLVIKQNPDNVHLGNMGYHLAIDEEEKAAEELRKHLKLKVKEILEHEDTLGNRK